MAQGKIHCVFIGIDEYHDTSISRLYCAVHDAQEMGDLFESIGADVTLLLNSHATGGSVRRSLWGLPRKVGPNDTAVLYFSGHGARVSIPTRKGDIRTIPCLLPCDAHHEELLATGVPMEELQRCFESIPCKRILFIFDSCYSGAVITDCRSFVNPGERSTGPEVPIFPSIAGEGMVILAASSEYQPAFEDRDSGHGVFTEFLIEALSGKASDGCDGEGISLDAVHKYVQNRVPKRTQSKFHKEQTPIQHGTFVERFVFPIMKPTPYRSLAGFPHQFSPLTVVLGDRRESPPKTAGDIFALSVSPAELRWLLGLRLPHDTEIISDKVFIQGSDAYLHEHYGERNLLVIGSPAANLLARVINSSAFFPFSVPKTANEQYLKISEEVRKITNNRPALVNFVTVPANRDAFAYYMNLFRKGGFIDPTYNFHSRGTRIPHDRDYGTVTLARNPYADTGQARFFSIMAAGVSLPGTMHSLTMLRDAKEKFACRPFGGIFSIELTEMDWIDRVTNAIPEWSTEEYDIGKLQKGLVDIKAKAGQLDDISENEIADRIKFLEQIVTASSVI